MAKQPEGKAKEMRDAKRGESRFGVERPLGRSLLFCMLPLAFAACTAIEPSETNAGGTPGITAPSGNETFPNLGSVPDQAPPAPSSAERTEVLEGLSADREQGQHTDQELGGESAGATIPPSPPQPAPAAIPGEPAAPSFGATPPPSAPTSDGSMESPAPEASLPSASASAATSGQNVIPAGPFAYHQSGLRPATYASGAVTVDMKALDGGSPGSYPTTVVGGSGAPAVAVALQPPGMPAAVIYFGDGSAELDAEDRSVLEGLLAVHRRQGGAFRVIGHASRDGRSAESAAAERANMEMSWARANAVARELVRNGVDPGAVETVGAGDSQLRYTESSPTGIAANRRAEIYLVF